MKLVCSVAVSNRLLPALAVSNKPKHVKSTLALCKNPKSDQYCIILFNNQNKTGTKYNIKGNISKILTKFISEGKATIQFKAPPHDLFITGEVIQLKGFLHLLKRALEDKLQPNELTYSSVGVTPVASKDMAPKKMTIKSRADYPIRGFPRTLEVLYINNINRCAVDKGILNLVRLKVLDLSGNLIEHVPEDLNRLPNLTELNLSDNHLHKSTPKQWNWLGGKLSQSLKLLNLDSNDLRFLPDQVAKLHNLTVLSVNNNQLTSLPDGVGNLKNLKTLNASNNSLTMLPGSMKKLHLDKIDLYNNKFSQIRPQPYTPQMIGTVPVGSLKAIARRIVLDAKLLYNPATIPLTLCDYLDHTKYCVCGKACFDTAIRAVEMLVIAGIAQNIVLATNESSYLPMDCHFCSLKCFRGSKVLRTRNPVI